MNSKENSPQAGTSSGQRSYAAVVAGHQEPSWQEYQRHNESESMKIAIQQSLKDYKPEVRLSQNFLARTYYRFIICSHSVAGPWFIIWGWRLWQHPFAIVHSAFLACEGKILCPLLPGLRRRLKAMYMCSLFSTAFPKEQRMGDGMQRTPGGRLIRYEIAKLLLEYVYCSAFCFDKLLSESPSFKASLSSSRPLSSCSRTSANIHPFLSPYFQTSTHAPKTPIFVDLTMNSPKQKVRIGKCSLMCPDLFLTMWPRSMKTLLEIRFYSAVHVWHN